MLFRRCLTERSFSALSDADLGSLLVSIRREALYMTSRQALNRYRCRTVDIYLIFILQIQTMAATICLYSIQATGRYTA